VKRPGSAPEAGSLGNRAATSPRVGATLVAEEVLDLGAWEEVRPAAAAPVPTTPVRASAAQVVSPGPVETAWARVDLGPPLPMAVYTAHETWNAERIGALALYCCDGRWGEAFDEFCHRRLLIPRYDRWAVPGGPAWLVPRDTVPRGNCPPEIKGTVPSSGGGSDLYQATRTQLDFLVHVHELERIVLITHFGCAFYQRLLGEMAEACVATQLEDLRSANKALRQWFPEMQVESYLAMQRGRCLSFHQLDG